MVRVAMSRHTDGRGQSNSFLLNVFIILEQSRGAVPLSPRAERIAMKQDGPDDVDSVVQWHAHSKSKCFFW